MSAPHPSEGSSVHPREKSRHHFWKSGCGAGQTLRFSSVTHPLPLSFASPGSWDRRTGSFCVRTCRPSGHCKPWVSRLARLRMGTQRGLAAGSVTPGLAQRLSVTSSVPGAGLISRKTCPVPQPCLGPALFWTSCSIFEQLQPDSRRPQSPWEGQASDPMRNRVALHGRWPPVSSLGPRPPPSQPG